MMTNRKIVAVSCTAEISAFVAVAIGGLFPARADDFETALRNRVDQVRQTCRATGEDPRLTSAAQRLGATC